MTREFGASTAKTLRLRLHELRSVSQMQDLLLLAGKWETLTGDRSGCWSARLNRNWRLIVRPEQAQTVVIIEIVDYH